MKEYKIDYEYGTATLLSKDSEEKPLDLFYELAEQCFGIRKSIGEVKLLSEGEVNLDNVEVVRHILSFLPAKENR